MPKFFRRGFGETVQIKVPAGEGCLIEVRITGVTRDDAVISVEAPKEVSLLKGEDALPKLDLSEQKA